MVLFHMQQNKGRRWHTIQYSCGPRRVTSVLGSNTHNLNIQRFIKVCLHIVIPEIFQGCSKPVSGKFLDLFHYWGK